MSENVLLEETSTLQACPYCGGLPQIAQIDHNKYIVYCTSCPACIHATWKHPGDAAEEWNHLSIDSIKLEDYLLSGVRSIAFSEAVPLESANGTAFQCQSVGISFLQETYDEVVVEMGDRYMICQTCSMYGRSYHNRNITDDDSPIEFVSFERERNYLKKIVFRCGKKIVEICANADKKCFSVSETFTK